MVMKGLGLGHPVGHHHRRHHRHRHRHLPMARAIMWGAGPLSEEEQIKLTMLSKTWRYCLIGLGIAFFVAGIVHSLETSFWTNFVSDQMLRLHPRP